MSIIGIPHPVFLSFAGVILKKPYIALAAGKLPFLILEVSSPTPNSQDGVPLLVGCPPLHMKYVHISPVILENAGL
jgi:hypothetical protein